MRIHDVFVWFFFVFLVVSPAVAGELQVIEPWVAEPPPGAKMLAGYMKIVNDSEEDVRLIGASGEDFGRVEIHRTIIEGAAARMERQHSLMIERGKTVVLQPKGLHLMLMAPKKPLTAGTTTTLVLKFNTNNEIPVVAEVRKKAR